MFTKKIPEVCPFCGEIKKIIFIREYKRQDCRYSLYQCSGCFVQFWEPRRNPGGSWYQDRNPYRIIDLIGHKVYRGYHRKFLKRHKNSPEKLRILDLGCGAGEFIAELQKSGFEVFGIDFDKKAIEIAKNEFGLKNVFSESLEEFLVRKDFEKFDFVTFFEVLEHLEDPSDFISKAKRLLKPSGKIVFSTPSRERVLVNANKWDFPPHHLSRWDKKSLESIFNRNGFQINYLSYVESFKIVLGAVDGLFRSGLVQKSINARGGSKGVVLPRILYLLAKIKQWVIAGLPAMFLWVFGMIFHRNNGIIYVELSAKNEK